jgi:hypothetical protein
MSEYQYYEFRAIDRPLNEREMRELRSLSSRARITPTSFTNEYQWGDFKGDPSKLMESYFDAFLYFANWGTHRLMLRLPQRLLSLQTAATYCSTDSTSAWRAGENVILLFESEDGGDDWEESEGWLDSLIPLRAELAHDDLRCLYLAWLSSVQNGLLDDEEMEPPVPANLGNLSASDRCFAEFLRIDEDLIDVAARGSIGSSTERKDRAELEGWLSRLAAQEKDSILLRLIDGEEPHLGAELMLRFNRERKSPTSSDCEGGEGGRRTVGQLLSLADAFMEEKNRIAAEKAALEKARRENEAKAVREKHLDDLAKHETSAWLKVDQLIATKQPNRYEEAIGLLFDLRDLAARQGKSENFRQRCLELRNQHDKKRSWLKRMDKAGLRS